MHTNILPIVAALALAMSGVAGAHTGEQHAPEQAQAAKAVKPVATRLPSGKRKAPDARAYFTDLEVIDQNGKALRFYSDVLANKVVMINVIYADCEDACPLITQALGAVRDQIPELFGSQVHFVTISTDPVTDTPGQLKKFAAAQGADVPGWSFLTGSKDNVDHILRKLGQFSEQREAHSTLLIAGNVPAKRWSKIRPEAPAAAIAERLRALAAAQSQARVDY